MSTVIQIVKAHLESNGYDGLVLPDAECGCCINDGGLAPCRENITECQPAYKYLDPDGSGNWVMYPDKDVDEEQVRSAIAQL
jgi:hypothetical protein